MVVIFFTFRLKKHLSCTIRLVDNLPQSFSSMKSNRHETAVENNSTELIVPQRRRVIQEREFAGLDDIRTVTIPDSVRVIKKEAFAGCHNLETVNLSNKLKTIEYGAFCDCYQLKSIVLPEGLESIGERLSSSALGWSPWKSRKA